MRFGTASLILVTTLLAVWPTEGAAQLTVTGPGIPPDSPVQVIVNPPGSVLGTATVSFQFNNDGSLPVDVFPFIQCPPDTVEAEIDTTPFTLAPNASTAVEASFADLRGGVTEGDQVVCTLDGGTQEFFDVTIEIVGVQPLETTLTTTIGLEPQTNAQEINPVEFDIEENLKIQALLGGLVANLDVGVGLTGTEFAIMGLGIPFGDLSLRNDIVFATPFNKAKAALGPTQFVTNRLRATLKQPAFTVDALLLLEDAHFPDPTQSELTSYPNPGNPDEQPAFGFGAILRLSLNPSLLGGAKITVTEAFCADPQNPRRIKKRSFMGRVECDDNDLGFSVEKIRIQGAAFEGVEVSGFFDFRPEGTSFTLSSTFPDLDVGTGQFTLKSGDVTTLLFTTASLGMRTNVLNRQLMLGGGLRLDSDAPAPVFQTDAAFPRSAPVKLTNSARLMPVSGGIRVIENRTGLSARVGSVTIRNEAIFCVPTQDFSNCRIPDINPAAKGHAPITLRSNQISLNSQIQNLAGQLDGKIKATFDISAKALNRAELEFRFTF